VNRRIARRLANLVVGALLAGVALGILTGAQRAAATSSAGVMPVDRLTLGQQVGQLIVLRFVGTTAPQYVRDVLLERRAAGVILFHDNVSSPGQLRALTSSLRRQGGRPIIAVDQEGGDIRILPWAPPLASEPEQGATGTAGLAARKAGPALRTAGITVSLAPVADVPSVSDAALASRAFSRDPERVSRAMTAAVTGWRAGGVASTAKHFPGLGGATVNTDYAPVTIRRTHSQLEETDLPPFEAAIQAGVPLVMVGHARYPALDPRHIASQSRPIIEGVLRAELGFRGVVLTDSMEAKASLATGAITSACERAVRAGADVVLLTGRGAYAPVYQHLLVVAQRSPSFRARIRESATRVLALKQRGARPPR
jgi:beta-N-acetylhexosaminidase